ncbi:hypothetical protein HPB52_020436 [Rhipicephalus sanguineus]|uniref:Uncharacterized protein n=1 Tax=Rhipicephalus sanguineus TaxID=34632 RepID=A0A9D4PP18_RHISA|nr:hypothetical protein HPB52_020436 [Rhipicephalus sanguineus]
MERFACPSPDRMGRYRCIDDHVLCDGFIDCPQGEDEDRMSCMFYKTDATEGRGEDCRELRACRRGELRLLPGVQDPPLGTFAVMR